MNLKYTQMKKDLKKAQRLQTEKNSKTSKKKKEIFKLQIICLKHVKMTF